MFTEKEKMLRGEVYDCSDPELFERWKLAQELSTLFNQTSAVDFVRKKEILKRLFGSCGENIAVTAPIHCDYGENIHVGENCEINFNCTFLDCNTITIGKNALIAPNVQFYAVGHPVKASDRMPEGNSKGFPFLKCISAPIKVGDNVWIGGGSILLPGITIGDNVTIGAGSVVNKDIPSNCLAAGNPCRVIRSL